MSYSTAASVDITARQKIAYIETVTTTWGEKDLDGPALWRTYSNEFKGFEACNGGEEGWKSIPHTTLNLMRKLLMDRGVFVTRGRAHLDRSLRRVVKAEEFPVWTEAVIDFHAR